MWQTWLHFTKCRLRESKWFAQAPSAINTWAVLNPSCIIPQGGLLLSPSTLPIQSSLDSCWSPTPMALSCFIMTPCDSISNGDSQHTLCGTTVCIEVGFQLFGDRAISVVKYFHDHQDPSIIRCVASHFVTSNSWSPQAPNYLLFLRN